MAFRCARCINNKFKYIRSEDSLSCLEYTGADRLYKIEPFSQSDFAKIDKKRTRFNTKKDRANEKARLYFLRFNTTITKAARI
jgi:hypothetical protein